MRPAQHWIRVAISSLLSLVFMRTQLQDGDYLHVKPLSTFRQITTKPPTISPKGFSGRVWKVILSKALCSLLFPKERLLPNSKQALFLFPSEWQSSIRNAHSSSALLALKDSC